MTTAQEGQRDTDAMQCLIRALTQLGWPAANDDVVILDTDEVAKLLRTTRSTVYEMARTGDIPCRKVGRAYRFERSAVLDWVRATGRVFHGRKKP